MSKTNVTDYARCPYTFWLIDTGAVAREDAFAPFTRRIMDDGTAFEAALVDEMPEMPAGLDVREMEQRADFVFSDEIVENPDREIFGIPDGIEVKTQAPVEIKNRMRAEPLDKVELAFYWLLLEPFRKVKCEPFGWLKLVDGEMTRTDILPRHFAQVDRLIRAVRHARSSGVEPRACSCFVCKTRPEVQAVKRARSDVALVSGVGTARALALARCGVKTVAQLCDIDPRRLAVKMHDLAGTNVSAAQVDRMQSHARAIRDNVVIRRTEERFAHENFIALDLEYDSMPYGSGNGVWLVGALLWKDGSETILQEVCVGHSERRRALETFRDLVKEHPGLPIVTWNGTGADIPQLTRAAKRCAVRFPKGSLDLHIDLFALTKRSVDLPIPSLALKELGVHLGVSRTSSITDGLEAGFVFQRYRSTKDKTERASLREELFRYNRDDLVALRTVANYLRSI